MKSKIILSIFTIFITANAGFCAPASVHDVVVKFSLAMAGVVISSIAIFGGLSIYNKIRTELGINLSEPDEIIQSPKNKDEAIKFFIRKNKIM